MAPKRILLMYITEVSGHHSASLAVEKALRLVAPDTEILNINGFNYTNPLTEKIVNKLYITVIKNFPGIWDFLYDNQKVIKKFDALKHKVNKFNSKKLKKLFDKFKPDIVACSQAFPCGIVAGYKKKYNPDLKLVGILTDFVPHSFWLYDEVDNYIVPSEEIAERMSSKGIPREKIVPLGIPFDPKFNDFVNKEKVMQDLKLVPGIPTVLIMGGGQGLGPIKAIIKSLDKVESNLQEIVVTGTNKKLFRYLRDHKKDFRKLIVPLGYVSTIHELMSISDIIITKPGGITTSEALAKKLPMLIIKPIPGQEENNTIFLTGKKAALRIQDPSAINEIVEDLLKHPGKLKDLSDSACSLSRPRSSLDIAQFLLQHAEKKE